MTWFSNVLNLLREILGELRALKRLLRLRTPGQVFVRVISEGENGMLKGVLTLPAKSAADVVSRELTVKIGSGEPSVLTLAADATESGEISGNDNDSIEGQLVDIDDAGNRSEPSTFSLVFTDTIAPAKPGEVGLRVTAEE